MTGKNNDYHFRSANPSPSCWFVNKISLAYKLHSCVLCMASGMMLNSRAEEMLQKGSLKRPT